MSDPEIIGPNDKFDDPFADEPFAEPNTGMSRRAKLFFSLCLGRINGGVLMYLGRPAVWHYGLAAVRRRAFLAQVMRVSRHHRRG